MPTIYSEWAELLCNFLTGQRTKTRSTLTCGDTTVEFLIDAREIEQELPLEFCRPVRLATVPNVRIEHMGAKIVVLLGCGQPADRNGNLLLFRLKPNVKTIQENPSSPEVRLILEACHFIDVGCQENGIRPDRRMTDFLARN